MTNSEETTTGDLSQAVLSRTTGTSGREATAEGMGATHLSEDRKGTAEVATSSLVEVGLQVMRIAERTLILDGKAQLIASIATMTMRVITTREMRTSTETSGASTWTCPTSTKACTLVARSPSTSLQ
jgi:hypothetical protein